MNKKDLIKGFILASENGDDHFKASKLLAKQKLYGLAISHLILSGEESIKGLYFVMQFFDVTVSLEEMSELFTLHKTKHKKIKNANKFIKEMIIDFLNELSEGNEILKNDFEEIKKSIENSDYSQWSSGNYLKNRGFYVDQKGKKFLSPKEISKKQYKNFYQLAWELVIINRIMSMKINIELKNTTANSA